MMDNEQIENLIIESAKAGNVVTMQLDTLWSSDLDAFISQPTNSLLYDLNRSPETTLTLKDGRRWINDYAVYLVIKRLKEMVDAKDGE